MSVYKNAVSRLLDYDSNFVQQCIKSVSKEHDKAKDVLFIPVKLLGVFYRCGFSECALKKGDKDPSFDIVLEALNSDLPDGEKLFIKKAPDSDSVKGIELSRPKANDKGIYIHYGKLCKHLGIE